MPFQTTARSKRKILKKFNIKLCCILNKKIKIKKKKNKKKKSEKMERKTNPAENITPLTFAQHLQWM